MIRRRSVLQSASAFAASSFVCLTADAADEADTRTTPQELERIAMLEKSLTNAVLVGDSTDTAQDTKEPQADRYELGQVKHLGNGQWDQWLIQARIGESDVMLPITLPIHWAGDAAVITVDELAIPGLGTYTARVMVHGNHYAGFWTGKDHGGHLWGKIERAAERSPQR